MRRLNTTFPHILCSLIRPLVFGLLVGLAFNSTIAQPVPRDPLCEPGFLVGFFNGANSTRLEARTSKDRLQRIIGVTWKNQPVDYHVFYNSSAKETSFAKALPNFMEAIAQYDEEAQGTVSAKVTSFWQALTGGKDRDIPSESTSVWNSFKDAVSAVRSSVLRAIIPSGDQPTEADLGHMIASVDEAIKTSRKMLFIAHSQGNLFLNPVYDYVAKKYGGTQAVSAVHIGTPSATVRGPYTNVSIDKIINLFRNTVGSTAMPINWELPESHWETDSNGHSFLLTYLNQGLTTYSKITGEIRVALDQLKDPPLPKGYYVLEATLKFGSQLPFAGIEVSPTLTPPGYGDWSSISNIDFMYEQNLSYLTNGGWMMKGGRADGEVLAGYVLPSKGTDRWCGEKTVRGWALQGADDYQYAANSGSVTLGGRSPPHLQFPSLFGPYGAWAIPFGGDGFQAATRRLLAAAGYPPETTIKQSILSLPERAGGRRVAIYQCTNDNGACLDTETTLLREIEFYEQLVAVRLLVKQPVL
jgi:hypothetical protein